MDLMEPHFHKNHHVTYDSFFTSPALMDDLLDKSTHSTGTVIKTRKGMPASFRTSPVQCKNQGWGDGHSLGRQKSSLFVNYHWFPTVHTGSHFLIYKLYSHRLKVAADVGMLSSGYERSNDLHG